MISTEELLQLSDAAKCEVMKKIILGEESFVNEIH